MYHLVVTPKEGPVSHYYIDAATGLETKTVTEIEDPVDQGKDGDADDRLPQHRRTDGSVLDDADVSTVRLSREMKFEKVEFNVPIDDTLFKMPK